MIMKQIQWYGTSSGQKMNKNKCFFLTAPGTGPTRINKIRDATGFLDKQFPFEYLGCPIYLGRKKVEYFEKMLSKVVKRLNVWQSNMLSYGGKIVLIKSVLQSLPIYTLSALSPPKGTITLMEKHFARFSGVPKMIRGNTIGVLGKIYVSLRRKVGWVLEKWLTFVKHWISRSGGDSGAKIHYGQVWVSGNSHTWKTLTKIRGKAEPNMIWCIQDGQSSFWWDNWTGYGAIANYCPDYVHSSSTKVKEFIDNNEWDIQNLQNILPDWLYQHINTIKIGSNQKKDFIIWKPAADGVFQTMMLGMASKHTDKKIL
ncbi:uncharacterized protein LOC132644143 [Lycium barbarum]|uniref:uncharacterized protein LOC132644143 n=1 Tax=Lycium barbarum TaxID=112863 RepID=UPI00293E6BA1|nr:uncharacterized protein LOC132644143 [Lycium barbarum]